MKKRTIKVLCIILTLVWVLSGCDSSDYKKAMELYDTGSYEDACEIFTELGDYENSAEMAFRCRYEMAMDVYEAGDYGRALEMFTELGDHEKCVNLIQECKYQLAIDVYESGDYEQAITAFMELGNYSDSADRIRQCHYQLGLAAMDAEDYQQARSYFQAAEGWEDSEALMKDMAGEILLQFLREKESVVYRNPDPDYSVTIYLEGTNSVNMDYLIESVNDSADLKQDVTIIYQPGEVEAAVIGTSTMSITFMGKKSHSEEFAAGVLNIENYRYGDEMTWISYYFDGHDINGKPTDYRKSGMLYVASNAPVERTIQALGEILEENNLGITLQDLGFVSIK